jgi:O-antigen/teichoic acid export membrane protein
MALKGTLSLGALAIGMRLTGRPSVGVLAMAGVFALVLLFGEARFAVHDARPRWNPAAMRKLAVMALPLGFAMMLVSLNANMPRYFVEHWWGPQSLGVFAALSYLSVAGSTVVNAIGQAAMPRLALCYASDQRTGFVYTLAAMSAVAGALGAGGFAILALFGKPVLRVLYGAVYAERVDVALWVMGGATILYVASAMGYGLTSARCFRPQLPLFGVVTVVAAGASLLLVPRYGLIGAAAAQAIAGAVQLAGTGTILLWHMGRRPLAPVPLVEAVR